MPIPMDASTGDLFRNEAPSVAPASPLLRSFRRSIVRACAASTDGLMVFEFDARDLLARASDEDLQLLVDEAFVGAGPGCRRLLERSGADGETFLHLAEGRQLGWVLTVDTRKTFEWIASQRPHLNHLIDPAMCMG